ncbi:hypothetical protein [Peribacillus acanthi]|uniref:hypothetical protein n=1 Tax=Peribacillus acanthi TaxID=2171554 RepID=UPI000D3E2266|nr:hypothetical protein [Peribacillus acanthi]
MKLILKFIFLFVLIVSNGSLNANASSSDPFIKDYWIKENYKKNGVWYCLPEGGSLTINVNAINTKEILFWATPTGTGTYYLKKLIGKDNNEDDGWSIIWKYPSILVNSHIEVTAIGNDGKKEDKFLFNVTDCKK